jgi:hypothetical protein
MANRYDEPRSDMTQITRRLVRIPIWLRVSGIIALVLAGVLIGTMLLDSADVGGGHRSPGGDQEVDRGDHGPGDGNHGPGDQTRMGITPDE